MEAVNENRPKKKITTWAMRAALLEGEQHIVISKPAPLISMITINRPDVNNLMSHRTRAQIFNQLQVNDQDPDVRVTIIRGAGGVFSTGNDFDTNRDEVLPFFEPEIDGQTSRHVINGWFMINDLAKPVIAMVEGEAIGGGLELAAACDVCICADDAIIGYNAVRGQGLADYQILPWLCGMRNAMELILTNKPMTGIEAVQKGFATESAPAAQLEEKTLNLAARIAKIPSDLLAFNKKSVHRAFEAQGMRTNLRNGVDLEALMFKAAGAKMLTVRRGPAQRGAVSTGAGVPQRVPPPRPTPLAPSTPAVAVQAVSASSGKKEPTAVSPTVKEDKPSTLAPKSPVGTPVRTAPKPVGAPTSPVRQQAKAVSNEDAEDAVEDVSDVPKTVAKASPAKAPLSVPARAPAKAVAPAKPAAPGSVKAAGAAPAVKAAASPEKISAPATKKPVAPLTPKVAAAPVTPVKSTPVTAAKSTPATPARDTPAKKVEDEGGVQIHLHEAVHIHINNNRTPSKL